MDQMSVQYIECLERWYAYAYGIVEAAAATPPPTTTMTAPTRWAVIAEYTSNTYVQDIQYDAKIYNRLTRDPSLSLCRSYKIFFFVMWTSIGVVEI